jgi:hypothetical protein
MEDLNSSGIIWGILSACLDHGMPEVCRRCSKSRRWRDGTIENMRYGGIMNLLSSLKRRIAFAILLAVVPLLLVVVDGYRRERANAIVAIYRFLTKPWEDETLRATVREAFRVARGLAHA